MEKISSLNYFENLKYEGADFVRAVTEAGQAVMFSYSIALQALSAWSSNCKSVLGLDDQEILVGSNIFLRCIHPADRFLVMQELEKAINNATNYYVTYRWLKPDNNQQRWLTCRAKHVKRQNETFLDGVIYDVSESITSAAANTFDNAGNSGLLENLSDTIILLDENLRIVNSNLDSTGKKTTFNIPEINSLLIKPGLLFFDSFSDTETANKLKQAIVEIECGNLPVFHEQYSDNTNFWNLTITPFISNSTRQGILLTFKNANEICKANSKIKELSGLAGLHNMTIGLTHSFNNNLQAIIGNANLLLHNPSDKDLVKQTAKKLSDLACQSSELVRQMEKFEEDQNELPDETDLNSLLLELAGTINKDYVIGERIKMLLYASLPIYCVSGKLKQVLRQILDLYCSHLNNNTILKISSHTNYIHNSDNSSAISGLCFEVAPSAAISNKKPATPKKTRKTTLSELNKKLSSFKKAIESLDGQMMLGESKDSNHLYSSIKLNIDFPVEKPVNQLLYHEINNSIARPLILLVDDDLMVSETVQAMLIDLGYDCQVASNELSALAVFKKNKNRIPVAIVDAVMPGTEGAKIIRQFKRLNKTVRIIGFSGGDTKCIQSLNKAGADSILRKPVGIKQLKACVEKFVPAPLRPGSKIRA